MMHIVQCIFLYSFLLFACCLALLRNTMLDARCVQFGPGGIPPPGVLIRIPNLHLLAKDLENYSTRLRIFQHRKKV